MTASPVVIVTGASRGIGALVNNAGCLEPLARNANSSDEDWQGNLAVKRLVRVACETTRSVAARC